MFKRDDRVVNTRRKNGLGTVLFGSSGFVAVAYDRNSSIFYFEGVADVQFATPIEELAALHKNKHEGTNK